MRRQFTPPMLFLRLLLLVLINLLVAANAGYGQCSTGIAPDIRSSTNYWAICGNNALLLTSSSPTGNTWLLDGQAFDSSSASIGVTQPGNYRVVVTDASGCSDTSAVQQVIYDAGPPTPIVSSASTMICKGNSLTLSSSASTGNQWFMGETA